MKVMKYVLTLAVLLVTAGWASAATVTQMPGGTHSWTSSGGATAGWAHSFYEDGNLIDASILAVASVSGKQEAWVKTEVPTMSTRTQGGATVGAKGTVEAYVTGETGSKATAVGQINARVEHTDSISGPASASATIFSGLGEKWSKTFGIDVDYQLGTLDGAAYGKFAGYANADGKAQYSWSHKDGDDDTHDKDYDRVYISGSAEGKTTINGESKDNNRKIGAYHGPGPAFAEISTLSNVDPINGETMLISNASKVIDIAASNKDPCASSSASAAASATATGKSSALSGYQHVLYTCDPKTGDCDYEEYRTEATASQEDGMSADVYVLKNRDAAYANAWLGVYARADFDHTDYTADTGYAYTSSQVGTYASASRPLPASAGSAADGSDRTFGQAFITTGKWDAKASKVYDTLSIPGDPFSSKLLYSAELSGELSQVKDPTVANEYGIGAGAFLQNWKSFPAEADIELEQSARVDGDTKETWMGGYAYLSGPAAPIYGSHVWDGSGVYSAFKDLHVASDPDDEVFSTDVPNVEAYFWIDGTNDKMKNGPGYKVALPVFTPYGEYTPVYWTPFSPSQTERQAEVEWETEQPW